MQLNTEGYIGLALVISILSLSISGVIAAMNHVPPDREIMIAITSMISTMVGALIGKSSK